MKAFLGIDLGTSAIKALLMAEQGRILAVGSSELVLSVPKPAFAEQNPNDWWDASVAAVRQAIAACGEKPEIAGIGVSGQMLGSVLMDKSGKADKPCMIWMDQRASNERDFIENKLGLDFILDKTANYPLASLWAPKLLWLRSNEPERYGRIDKALFPKDYLKYRLTGEYDIDVTDAPGTLLFNTAERRWDDELFKALDIPRNFVPESLSESTQVIGRVTTSAAEALGVPAGIPVVGGGGDQMCGAVGLGVIRSGVISSVIGTSGCVFSHSDACITDRKPRALLSYCHSVSGAYSLFGCTLSAGGAYQWLRNAFFKNEKVRWNTEGKKIYAFMDALAAAAAPGCEGLVFLPYLSGERTPYPDPDARGVFFGLSQRHGAAECCRAVMEGVVYSLRDTVEILREHKLDISEAHAAGGGSASPLWLQMQADIFNTPVLVTTVGEAPAAGAAMLAAVGAGAYADLGQAADDVVKIVQRREPDAAKTEMYNDYYETYRSLYPALRHLYASQARKIEQWGN
jgi:xylulokinase